MGRVWCMKVNFNGTNGTSLVTEYGSTAIQGGCEIQSNGIDAIGAGTQADTFGSDAAPSQLRARRFSRNQYATIELTSENGTNSPGAMVRAAQDAGANGYHVTPGTHSTERRVYRWIAGGATLLGSGGSSSPSPGDTLEIEATGSDISAGLNNVTDVTVTDSNLTVSNPACAATQNTGTSQGENWEGGSLDTRVGLAGRQTHNSLRNRQGRPAVQARRRFNRIVSAR